MDFKVCILSASKTVQQHTTNVFFICFQLLVYEPVINHELQLKLKFYSSPFFAIQILRQYSLSLIKSNVSLNESASKEICISLCVISLYKHLQRLLSVLGSSFAGRGLRCSGNT